MTNLRPSRAFAAPWYSLDQRFVLESGEARRPVAPIRGKATAGSAADIEAGAMLTDDVIHLDPGQQSEQAFGDELLAGRRPMAAIEGGIGFGSVEGDERNSLGVQMLNELVIA